MIITKGVRASQADRQPQIIPQQFGEHVLGGHIILVIVAYALKSGDVADRMQGRAADLSDSFRNRIGGGEYLLALLVEQQVIISEMWARYMPMEILPCRGVSGN
jgi:hypothetical protein